MAIFAICPRRPILACLGVVAVRISLLGLRVALGAGYLLRGGLVDQALHILMAIHAGEQFAVDRMPQLVAIHIQAHLPAVYFRSQSGVGVASKTVRILELLSGESCRGPEKQE
jgi:hypothetical protein